MIKVTAEIGFQIYVISVIVIYLASRALLFRSIKLSSFKLSVRTSIIDTFIWLVLLLQSLTIYWGFNSPANFDSSVQNIVTQFIGSVLAIFFSLAIVPLSNIVKNTSSSFIYRIIRNKVFQKSLVLYFLIFLSISFQITVGLGKAISLIHLLYLVFSLTTFLFIIYEILRVIDVKNVISDFENEAIFNLEKRWKKITRKASNFEKQLQLMMIIKENLINEAKSVIEPIFVTTKRYIELDHYDVIAVGLNSIINIAKKYIDLFSFSIQDNDRLLIYLIERLKDLKSSTKDTTHYSVLANLVFAIKRLAIMALDIKTPLSKFNQSYLPLGLINFLKEFVVGKDILKETSSAPLDSINALEEIAIVASNKKNFNMAYSALKELSSISVWATKLNFLYSNSVSKEANSSILKIHYQMLISFSSNHYLPSFLVESIANPIKAYIEVGEDSPNKDNLSPFIGMGVDPVGITDPYSLRMLNNLAYITFFLIDKKLSNESEIFEYLEEIFSELNRLLREADNKKMFFLTKEIVDCTYGVVFTLLQFVEMKKINNPKAVKKLLDERLLFIFSNAFSGEFLKDGRWMNEKINRWVSVLGMYLVSFQTWEGFPIESIERLIQAGDSAIPKVYDTYRGRKLINHSVVNDLKEIIEYLNLALYWALFLLNNNLVETKLIKYIITNRENFALGSEHNLFPKPMMSFGEFWSLEQPFVAYYQHYLWDSREFLDIDRDNYYKFSSVMEKYEYRWNLIKLIKFKLGLIKSYEPYSPRRSFSGFGLFT